MSREKIKWLISTGLPILCLVLFVSAVSVLLVILLRVENLSEVIDLNIFRRMAIPDNGSNRLAGLLVFICGFLFCSRQLWSGGFTLRLLLKVTMVGSFLISLFIMSRGAIISFFTMSVAYATGMILGRKKIRVVPIVLSLVVILLVMQPFVINLVDRMKRVKVDYATYFRLAMWGDALLFMQKNPVIGAGPGQYRYQQFEAMKHDDPHNILLRYGVEFGAISSILILVIFVMPIYYFYVCYKKSNVVAVSTYIYLAPPLIGTAVHSMMDYIIPSMSFGPLYWTVWSIAIYLLKNIVKLDDIASE
jgi:O-antigen ligase